MSIIADKYAHLVDLRILNARPLTASEIQVLEESRANWPEFDQWFAQVCECTLPMLGNLYLQHKACFAKTVEPSEHTDFVITIHLRRHSVIILHTFSQDGTLKFKNQINVSPIGVFFDNECHLSTIPCDSVEFLMKTINDEDDDDEDEKILSTLTERIYRIGFVLTTGCLHCNNKGSENTENVDHDHEEDHEEDEKNESVDTVDTIEGVDLADASHDTFPLRVARITDMYRSVMGNDFSQSSAKLLAEQSFRNGGDIYSFFKWFTDVLSIRRKIGPHVRDQTYACAFLPRWRCMKLARSNQISIIRSSDVSPFLLTVFTPVDDSRIREWWVIYDPSTEKFTHRDDANGIHRIVDHISKLFEG